MQHVDLQKREPMINRPRVGTPTRRLVWMIGAMLAVAALTSSGGPWKWGFALLYVTIAFGLQTLVRMKDPGIERLTHVFVLAGSAPIMVGSYYGSDLGAVGVVHVAAMLTVSIGIGYLLAERVRPHRHRQGTT